MGFYEVANHPLIYGIVILGIIVIVAMTLLGMHKAWLRAVEIGIPREKLIRVVKSSVSFAIIPSAAIVVGFFSLAAMLGVPWPWWRLSVVGSLTYEVTAANMALNAAGTDLANAAAADFILIMWVMTIGIIAGLVVAPFIAEKIQTGTMKLKARDQHWGALSSGVFMLAIIIAFSVPMFFGDIVKTLTLITSAVICMLLAKAAIRFKLGWLREFILVFTMILSMALSLVWTAIFK